MTKAYKQRSPGEDEREVPRDSRSRRSPGQGVCQKDPKQFCTYPCNVIPLEVIAQEAVKSRCKASLLALANNCCPWVFGVPRQPIYLESEQCSANQSLSLLLHGPGYMSI